MDSEREQVSILIEEETGLPTPDFGQWTYSGNPAVMFAAAHAIDLAVKDGALLEFDDVDRLSVTIGEKGEYEVVAPMTFTKMGLHVAARMVETVAKVISEGVFSFIHAERLKQHFAKQPRIVVPSVDGVIQ